MDVPLGTTVTVLVPPPPQEPEWTHAFLIIGGVLVGLVIAGVLFFIFRRRKIA